MMNSNKNIDVEIGDDEQMICVFAFRTKEEHGFLCLHECIYV